MITVRVRQVEPLMAAAACTGKVCLTIRAGDMVLSFKRHMR